ncbi:hypothetical protein CBM2637_B140019 [Cupriavidus taiwanensis]|nr:hypothetical protein CBM2637_B140019 [Cupriavidus taiwanensis]SPA43207.1 protein of unknown function [Cupriavidus taiwanensis]
MLWPMTPAAPNNAILDMVDSFGLGERVANHCSVRMDREKENCLESASS